MELTVRGQPYWFGVYVMEHSKDRLTLNVGDMGEVDVDAVKESSV